MKTYVITFSKVGIRDGWVEVQAREEEIARAWAHREYGPVWSMIYEEERFGPSSREFYPLGCFSSSTVLYHESAEHIA